MVTNNAMTIHKRTKLTPVVRHQLAEDYHQHHVRVCDLATKYRVSRPTVYKVIHRARQNDYTVHKSTNRRFRCLEYGLKRLARVELALERTLKAKAKRYNKRYPGEMLHGDTKRLPLLEGELSTEQREYLFVAIDDFSRELYAAILPDKTQYSAATFLQQVIVECPYTIETWYTDNGTEYRGDAPHHAFMRSCTEAKIEQRFTKVRTPQTNGKAERVIKTLMEMWHKRTHFTSRVHRKQELVRFVNWYNTVKPHASLENRTPMEQLIAYFYPQEL